MNRHIVYAQGIPRDLERSRVRLDALSLSQLLLCQNPKCFLLHGLIKISLLKRSLSLCLTKYSVLAGRLFSPPPHIARRMLMAPNQYAYLSDCNSGVLFEVEESRSVPVDKLIMHRTHFPHEIGCISVPPSYISSFHDPLKGTEPITKIKVAFLGSERGEVTHTLLSFNFIHCVVDGFSASSFINCLASLYSHEETGGASPFHMPAGGASPFHMPAEIVFDRSELFSSQATRARNEARLPALKSKRAANETLLISATTQTAPRPHPSHLVSSLLAQAVPLPGWARSIRSLISLVKMAREEEKTYPRMRSDMSSITLHLPLKSVQALKLKLDHPGLQLTTNDLLSSLIWCLFASLRNRPLPSEKDGGTLGLAIDLRKNAGVSASLFGNAVWALAVQGGRCDDLNVNLSISQSPYLMALMSGARKIREALEELRSHQSPSEMISHLAESMCLAPLSSQYHLAANLMKRQDAMVSSWPFEYHKVRFGSLGTPLSVMGFVLPSPPWSAAILSSTGGFDLILTVPSSSLVALRSSHILNELVQEGRFYS